MALMRETAAYWEWKARENRVAARFVQDAGGRLALLKMAEIYQRLSDRSKSAAAQPQEPPLAGTGVLAAQDKGKATADRSDR